MGCFELPDGAEEHLFEFGKQDYMEIAHDLLEKTFPHIAFGRDPSRTTYSLPSIVSFLAHLALEGAYPENGSDTFTHMDIYENGGTGADNFYYYVRRRTAEEWFDRFLRANAELLEEARSMGHFENASEVASTPPASRGSGTRRITSWTVRSPRAITPTLFTSRPSASSGTRLRSASPLTT